MQFSVITPVYNRQDCVSRCIESVLRQTLFKKRGMVEIILVDDGSSDLTTEICAGYAKNNECIHFVRHRENKGTNAARNTAVKVATGDYIVILDSDDFFVDDALEYMATTIEKNPEFKHYMFAPDDVSYRDLFFQNCESKILLYEDFLKGKVKTGFIHCIAANTMRKYPFDEQVRIHEGVFFLSFYKEARMMLFTNRVVTIRERGRGDSVTLDCVRSNRALIERATKANEMMLERFGQDFRQYACDNMLRYIYGYLYDNYLLLGQYDKIKQLEGLYNEQYRGYKSDSRKVKLLHTVYSLHLGTVYRLLLQFYLGVKYKIFNYKIK